MTASKADSKQRGQTGSHLNGQSMAGDITSHKGVYVYSSGWRDAHLVVYRLPKSQDSEPNSHKILMFVGLQKDAKL